MPVGRATTPRHAGYAGVTADCRCIVKRLLRIDDNDFVARGQRPSDFTDDGQHLAQVFSFLVGRQDDAQLGRHNIHEDDRSFGLRSFSVGNDSCANCHTAYARLTSGRQPSVVSASDASATMNRGSNRA